MTYNLNRGSTLIVLYGKGWNLLRRAGEGNY